MQLLRKTVDDRAISDFSSGFEHNLQVIRASGFEDTTTRAQAREL